MDSTLPFLIQRKICYKILIVGIVVAFKNICLLLALICIKKNDKWI